MTKAKEQPTELEKLSSIREELEGEKAELICVLEQCLDLLPPLRKPSIAGRQANRIEAPVIIRAHALLLKVKP